MDCCIIWDERYKQHFRLELQEVDESSGYLMRGKGQREQKRLHNDLTEGEGAALTQFAFCLNPACTFTLTHTVL